MCSYESSDDRLSTAQMNSELQHAQLELLAAHCATHKLRLHYSADDLARFGRRDVLRKSDDDESLRNVFREALRIKPLEHQFRSIYQPDRPMIAIGG